MRCDNGKKEYDNLFGPLTDMVRPGLNYAGDVQKGIILAMIAIIVEVLYLFVSQIFGIVVLIIWIYSLYMTYHEVKVVNG